MARASVKGFQGEDLSDPERMLACAKHFAGYGGAEGGRDYNTVEISENTMRNVYLPSFEAAVKAGIKTVLIPRMNINDVLIEEQYKPLVKIIPVDRIDEVLKYALVPENMDGFLAKLKQMTARSTAIFAEAPSINKTAA